MKRTRTAIIALLATVASAGVAISQPPPPGSQEQRDRNRDRYDDRRNDDRRGDRRGDRWERDGDRRGGWRDRRGPSPRREVGFFYDELSPYGDWVLTREYGWAWFPNDVDPDWRPYSDGRWIYTDYGWTWASFEPFGWATYHYGRWAWDRRFGWLWVPGTVWGPAWVSWQQGGGYIGWAPLPPAVGFDFSVGIRLGNFDLNIGLQPDIYTFVSERRFVDPRLAEFLVPSYRNPYIYRNTRNVTDYRSADRRVMNRGIDMRRIEAATGRPVRRLRVAELRNRADSVVSEREFRVYRPQQIQLDSVRIGPEIDEGLRNPPPPPEGWDDEGRAEGRDDDRRDAGPDADWGVAPRARPPARFDARRFEQEERQQQQELERYQAEERRQIEKAHQQELQQAGPAAQKQQLQQRQEAEKQQLQKEQAKAAEQLKARLEAQREALQSQPADDKEPPPDDQR
jgi:flagellar biosynthesis/type III secretory pathway protein FliH